jgi:hypothetical protein
VFERVVLPVTTNVFERVVFPTTSSVFERVTLPVTTRVFERLVLPVTIRVLLRDVFPTTRSVFESVVLPVTISVFERLVLPVTARVLLRDVFPTTSNVFERSVFPRTRTKPSVSIKEVVEFDTIIVLTVLFPTFIVSVLAKTEYPDELPTDTEIVLPVNRPVLKLIGFIVAVLVLFAAITENAVAVVFVVEFD